MRWQKEKRTAYYAMVRKHRGDQAAQELVDNVRTEWNLSSNDG
jgi:hypothetical protein